MLADGFGRLGDLTDYAAYGGAPILGFKSHDRSDARVINNAIKAAAKGVRDGVIREIVAATDRL
ncbi:MAG: hypothetical protein ABSA52_11920 [Candidatus Binatia bacterium]|jgi:fatty acid/phospholipid biosynthesis enzyme